VAVVRQHALALVLDGEAAVMRAQVGVAEQDCVAGTDVDLAEGRVGGVECASVEQEERRVVVDWIGRKRTGVEVGVELVESGQRLHREPVVGGVAVGRDAGCKVGGTDDEEA